MMRMGRRWGGREFRSRRCRIGGRRRRLSRAQTGDSNFATCPAGNFRWRARGANFLVTTYQWHEGFSTAIVTGAGLETENLVLRMIPFGSIAGRVIDEAGEPVRNARVKLYMRNQQFGQRSRGDVRIRADRR